MNQHAQPSRRRDLAPSAAQVLRVLVVEDEGLFAQALAKHLRKAHFACEVAGTLAAARALLDTFGPDLILLDMRLPDGSGLDLLQELGESETPDIPVVVLTAFGELEDAVAAMKLNAIDYLRKPIDLDELLLALEKVVQRLTLARRLDYSRQRETLAIEGQALLGESAAMRRIKRQLERIAQLVTPTGQTAPTVLLLGETGSGKDLAAKMLHRCSARRHRPFIHLDCAALPKELIESELFGHEKGAFTDARKTRTGLIEAAEDGTVFLDEIAELPLDLQPKLLAVLERRAFRRLGSSHEQPVDAWFIAGTNRPLKEMVDQGRFRSDLYYRLKVLTLTMPPLRERSEDIPMLARNFAAQTARRFGLLQPDFERDALAALCTYAWPGNVRELEHLVERAVLLSGGDGLLTKAALTLDAPIAESTDPSGLDGMTLAAVERLMIERTLARTAGNVSQAARELGVTRMALRYRMKQHGVSSSELREQ